MTLLICLIAAVISTVIWYKNAPESKMKLGLLCWMYWGASLMWMVDAIAEYIELREEYFAPAAMDMLNDAFLGLSVVVFGMVIWIVVVLVTDPHGVIKRKLLK